MLSEISQGQIWYDITYVWNLKTKTSEYNKKKQTYRQKTNHCLQQGESRGGAGEEQGIKRYKLLCTK